METPSGWTSRQNRMSEEELKLHNSGHFDASLFLSLVLIAVHMIVPGLHTEYATSLRGDALRDSVAEKKYTSDSTAQGEFANSVQVLRDTASL